MQGAASSAEGQRPLRCANPLSNTYEVMRQRDAQCLQGEGVALQVLALPAWLASLSVRGEGAALGRYQITQNLTLP